MVTVDDRGNLITRSRLPVANGLDELLNSRSTLRITGRIADFSGLRARAARLSFDTTEDSKLHALTVSVPGLLLSTPQFKVQSHRLMFDTANDTLTGSETLAIEPDGTSTTIKVSEVYQDFNGVTYHVGRVTKIDRHIPRTNDISGYGMHPVQANISNLREITKEEIEEIRNNGGQALEFDPVLGDPSSLDTSETIQEIFPDVQVNADLNDADFAAAQ